MSKKLSEARIQYELKRLDYLKERMHAYQRTQKRKATIRLAVGSLLALIVSLSLAFLFVREIPAQNKDVVITIVSALSGAFFGSVISYYFGDSDNAQHVPPPDDSQMSTGLEDDEDATSSPPPGIQEP